MGCSGTVFRETTPLACSDRTFCIERLDSLCLTAGANVVMACRDIKKCRRTRKELVEATKNTNIVCEELDLASLESVREFATRITASELLSLHLFPLPY